MIAGIYLFMFHDCFQDADAALGGNPGSISIGKVTAIFELSITVNIPFIYFICLTSLFSIRTLKVRLAAEVVVGPGACGTETVRAVTGYLPWQPGQESVTG